MNRKRVIYINIIILFVFISAFLFPPTTVWVATYALVGLAVLIATKYILQLAMRLVWNVQVEPPATDVMLVAAYIKYVIERKKIILIKNTYTTYIILYILISTIQLGWSTDIISAAKFHFITIYVLMLYPIIIYIFGKQYGLQFIISSLLFSAGLTAVGIAVAAIAGKLGYGEQFPWLYYVSNRPKGFFKDANVAGPFVVMGVLYLFSKILIYKKYNKMELIYTLFMLITVILTFSRGALLNMIIGLLVIGYFTLLRRRGLQMIIVFLLIAAPAAVYFQYALSAFGQKRVIDINYYDVQGRLGAWKSGLLMARDYPLGVGPGQFEQHAIDYQTKYIKNEIPTKSAHNTYIRLLTENSALGLLLFVLAAMYVLVAVKRRANKMIKIGNVKYAAISVWVVSVLVGALAEGMVVDILHWRHLGITLGIGILLIDRELV